MKYSIIVPVYNVEEYIEKCLTSIYNQTYSDYEVIIVDDGSIDNSIKIINKFVKRDERFKVYSKENGGLSDARNFGIEKATGDAILFIDGDDYIDEDLLSKLTKEFEINRDIDLIRFQLRLVDDKGNVLKSPDYNVFSNIPSNVSYENLLKNVYVDKVCCYAYRKNFFLQNKFKYAKGKIYEDLGLIHLIIIKSKNISSIDYVGYNFVQRNGNMTNNSSRKYNLRRVYDTLFHYDNYLDTLNKDTSITLKNKELLKNYLINNLTLNAKFLKDEDLDGYLSELKKRKINL